MRRYDSQVSIKFRIEVIFLDDQATGSTAASVD